MRVQQQAANNQLPQPLYEPRSTHTPTRKQTVGERVEHQSCGGHSTGETPSNIPNLEAKPGSANGTATDRLWESRTPPQHNKTRGTAPPHGVPSLPIPTPPPQATSCASATGSATACATCCATGCASGCATACASGCATSSATSDSARPPPGELSTNVACNSPNTAPHHATIP